MQLWQKAALAASAGVATLGLMLGLARGNPKGLGLINAGIDKPTENAFKAIDNAGMTVFRHDIFPTYTPTAYNFGVVKYGLDMVGNFDNWAFAFNNDLLYHWTLADFDRILTQYADAYPRIKYWGVFEEMDYRPANIGMFITGYLNVDDPDLRFTRYIEILQHARDILHPRGMQLLAPAFTTWGTTLGYYDRFYNAGGNDLVDKLTFHCYGDIIEYWLLYLPSARAKYTKPFWNDEWATADDGVWNQSTFLRSFMAPGMPGTFFEKNIWWLINDAAPDNPTGSHVGLMYRNFAPKPIYHLATEYNYGRITF